MKANCPYCGKGINMDEIIDDADMRAIMKLMGSFGQEGALVLAYLDLFGVSPFSKHKKKIMVILKEMKSLLDAERFQFRKRDYTISRKGIAEALNVVVHRQFTDRLENHNYLKKIMLGISEKEGVAKSKQDEAALREREAGLRRGDHLTEEQLEENRRRAARLAKGIF